MQNALATFLVNLSARANGEGLNRQTLRLRVRREDLARHLDMTPRGLESEFRRLVSRRAISLTLDDTVTILDDAALAASRAERTGTLGGFPPTPEHALSAILADERFAASPRVSTLLVYLVEKAMDGEIEQLDARRIGIEALGKPEDFDPGRDPALRVLITRLRRMLDDYHADGLCRDGDREDDVVIRVMPGTYRLSIEMRSLPERPPTVTDGAPEGRDGG